jgi:hypothetical protein
MEVMIRSIPENNHILANFCVLWLVVALGIVSAFDEKSRFGKIPDNSQAAHCAQVMDCNKIESE